ncbi:MAG: pitrilysin family protein [Ghiorsea sp.]|nr:pitrilysin family protein [Ghiorsea sp.]
MKVWIAVVLGLMITSQAMAAPVVQQKTLDNGLNILLIEAHNVPMVAIKLVVPAGSRFDAKDKGGSAALLSGLLMDHTKKHDYQAWAAKLDDAAIRLGSGVDKDTMSFSLTVLREALDEGVQALSEAVLQPGWQQKRFEFLQQNAISAATKAREEATTYAAEEVNKLLFPNHPYGHAVSGNVLSLKHIQLVDLKNIYQQQVKPDGAVLAVSGDITMDELVAALQPYLSGWQGKPAHAFSDITTPQPSVQQASLVTLDKHQALVEWVRLGPSRHDDNYKTLLVLNHMLGGGGFGSRLMEEIREKRGLVYGVYSFFQPLETKGVYTIRLLTKANQAAEAEAVLRDVLQGLADGHISRADLNKSKRNLMGGFAQRMDSNRERAGLLAMMGVYQRPLDYLQNWTKSVRYVTLADVKKAAKQYLQPKDWKRVLVGPDEMSHQNK